MAHGLDNLYRKAAMTRKPAKEPIVTVTQWTPEQMSKYLEGMK